jgi:LuxR family maltose regulon positive regulatory protein
VTTLLTTKLFEPAIPRTFVARPRLVDKLVTALSSKVTLLSAPAGYGKSTLLGDWRASTDGGAVRLAWMSVDEADNDPVRFWAHVAAALQRASVGLGEAMSDGLLRPTPSPIRPLLEELLNELAALDELLVVVLDDLHAVATPQIFESLAFLVAHLPPSVRLVIASRTDPPLPLAALRARGELSELRARDLRFTREEARGLLTRHGIVLDGGSLDVLEVRTEGWAAGIHLAALTLADLDDGAGFVRSFAGDDRAVVDFLIEEVLSHQPDEVTEFLLATSVLARMSGPLCEAVAGRPGGQAMLTALERANLFLVPLDHTRTWFRYHHLFAELLRRELRARDPAREAELHRRAARWFSGEGSAVEAIPHAVAATDWGLACELAIGHGLTLLVEGQAATLRDLFHRLPEPELRARPDALVGFAWMALVTADLEQLQARLEVAEAALATLDAVRVNVRIYADFLWSLLCVRRGDLAGNEERLTRIERLLAEHPEIEGMERVAREGGILVSRARTAFVVGDLARTDRLVAEALAVYREHRPAPGVVEALGLRALLALADGRCDDARRDADEALELSVDRGLEGTTQGAVAHLPIGALHLERLELDDAERHLARALEVFRADRDVNSTGLATAMWADRLRLAGRPDEALETVVAVRRERDGDPPPLVARLLTRAEAMACSALGDHAGSRAAMDGADGLSATAAVVALAAGDAPAALGAAELVLASSGEPYRRRERISALAVAAIAHDVLGDRDAARAQLAQALRVAAPTEWLAPFAELGAPLRALALAVAPDPNPAVAGIRKRVLDAFDGQPVDEVAQVGLVDKLTERELAVLRRLPSSLSTVEIARMLYVSVNTVKSQVQSIYRKLGVNSRHEAVEAARRLDLL